MNQTTEQYVEWGYIDDELPFVGRSGLALQSLTMTCVNGCRIPSDEIKGRLLDHANNIEVEVAVYCEACDAITFSRQRFYAGGKIMQWTQEGFVTLTPMTMWERFVKALKSIVWREG